MSIHTTNSSTERCPDCSAFPGQVHENSCEGGSHSIQAPPPPTLTYTAIHSRVLVIAKQRIEGTWKAYVTPVPGRRHEEELHLWENEGCELSENRARVFFPQFKEIPYSR